MWGCSIDQIVGVLVGCRICFTDRGTHIIPSGPWSGHLLLNLRCVGILVFRRISCFCIRNHPDAAAPLCAFVCQSRPCICLDMGCTWLHELQICRYIYFWPFLSCVCALVLSRMLIVASLTSSERHWYYSNNRTTFDRASMACEDMGTRLMTMDEVLTIREFFLTYYNNWADRFIWVLDPFSIAPLAFNMKTNEEKNSFTALIMCKSSSEYTFF